MKRFSGAKLKQILEEKGISQATLAEKLELSPATVSTWINDRSLPERANIERTAEILSVNQDELMDAIPTLSNVGNNSVVVYNYAPLHINTIAPVDSMFLDANVQSATTVGFKMEALMLEKILLKARENNKGAGQLFVDIINDYLNS